MTWDTKRLREALKVRHPQAGWALLEEVSNGTGKYLSGYADALAMSLWPSHHYGLELHGFEIKASRADWLNELKQPEKWQGVGRYCDKWWLVIADRAMVKDGELPANWGLLAPNAQGTQLDIVKPAPALVPLPWDRPFMAAVMRRVNESSATQAQLDDTYARGVKDGWQHAENAQPALKSFRRRAQRMLRDGKQLLENETHVWRHAPSEK